MGTKQKTVIVTGASQGIGAWVAQAFLDRGYNVVANSRNITKSGAFNGSGQLALVDIHDAGSGALRKLPPPRADGIPKLFHQLETAAVVRHHQRVVRLVHHGVDAGAAVRAADVVLAEHQPRVSIDLAGRDGLNKGHAQVSTRFPAPDGQGLPRR